jgi:predicted transcriptional regulator
MRKLEQLEFDHPASVEDDEDKETLAAIDEGIRDAEAGRTATPEQARRLLSKCITESSKLKGR